MHCGKSAGQTMRMAGHLLSRQLPDADGDRAQPATRARAAMQMQMRVEARRIGECSAKQG